MATIHVQTKAQARRAALERGDALEDIGNRAALGLPPVDFDTGEPCACDYCYARGDLVPESAKHAAVPLRDALPQAFFSDSMQVHGSIPGL